MSNKVRIAIAMVLAALTIWGSYFYLGRFTRGVIALIGSFLMLNVAFVCLVFVDMHPLNVLLFLLILLIVWLAIVIDSFRIARRSFSTASVPIHRRWYQLAILLVMSVVLSAYASPVFGEYKGYYMPGGGMENTVMRGDYLLADLNVYRKVPPANGDIVLFLLPSNQSVTYIKRSIAGPGDLVEVRDLKLYVNDKRISLPFTAKLDHASLSAERLAQVQSFGPYVVPDDCYFMIGDNLYSSFDSRFFGAVPEDLIFGKAVRIYLSSDLGRIGLNPR